jgi:ATP-binding cassette subfamily B protein
LPVGEVDGLTSTTKRQTLRTLAEVAWQYPGLYLAAWVAWLVITLTPLLSALLLGHAVASLGHVPPATAQAAVYSGAFLFAELVRIAAVHASVFFDIHHRTLVGGTLRVNLLRRILAGGRRWRGGIGVGDLVLRSRDDVKQLEDTVSDAVDLSVNALFTVGAILIYARINLLLALAAACVMICVVAGTSVLGRRLESVRDVARGATTEYEKFLGDMLGAIEVVQLGTAERRVSTLAAPLNAARTAAAVTDRTLSSAVSTVGSYLPLVFGGVVLVVLGTSWNGSARAALLGKVATSLYLASFLSDSALLFAEYLPQLGFARLSLARLQLLTGSADASCFAERVAVLPRPVAERGGQDLVASGGPPPPGASGAPCPLLVVSGLRDAQEEEHRPGVDVVKLVVPQRSIVVLSGPVGSGKTRLLQSVLALERETVGKWRWNGQPLQRPDALLRWPNVGYVPPSPHLIDGTIRDNLVMGRPVHEEALHEALHAADFLEVLDWPEGLETLVGPDGSRLSGGQRQRVVLARALAGRPLMLVLDDPTSSLDEATSSHVWAALHDLVVDHGKTLSILAASNDEYAVGVATTRIQLDAGRFSPA